MQLKPNPADFTHNGELQQPHYDNAVRAWGKMERMGQDEIEKAARSKSYKYREATHDKFVTVGKDKVQAISAALNARSGFEDGFKAGAEWANEQKGKMRWVKASEIEYKQGQTYYAKWASGTVIRSTGVFQMSDGTFFWNEKGYIPILKKEHNQLLILIEQ